MINAFLFSWIYLTKPWKLSMAFFLSPLNFWQKSKVTCVFSPLQLGLRHERCPLGGPPHRAGAPRPARPHTHRLPAHQLRAHGLRPSVLHIPGTMWWEALRFGIEKAEFREELLFGDKLILHYKPSFRRPSPLPAELGNEKLFISDGKSNFSYYLLHGFICYLLIFPNLFFSSCRTRTAASATPTWGTSSSCTTTSSPPTWGRRRRPPERRYRCVQGFVFSFVSCSSVVHNYFPSQTSKVSWSSFCKFCFLEALFYDFVLAAKGSLDFFFQTFRRHWSLSRIFQLFFKKKSPFPPVRLRGVHGGLRRAPPDGVHHRLLRHAQRPLRLPGKNTNFPRINLGGKNLKCCACAVGPWGRRPGGAAGAAAEAGGGAQRRHERVHIGNKVSKNCENFSIYYFMGNLYGKFMKIQAPDCGHGPRDV